MNNKRSYLLFFTIFLVVNNLYSQDIARVDAAIGLYPKSFDSPEKFSKFITRDFPSEEEKVRAVYTWLINNVAYDPKAYKLFDYSFKNYRDRNNKEEKNRKKIIAHTLKTGKAVCEGYAMTFEKILTAVGISNYLVRGDTKTNFQDIGRDFNNNHMWNAVQINNTYYLFDATWGAGKYNEKFIKEPTYAYYKIKPNVLLNTHLPQQIEDTFSDKKITREAFFARPLIINRFITINDIIQPKEGFIVEKKWGGVVDFIISTTVDTISYSYGNEIKILSQEEVETQDNTTRFSIPLIIGATQLIIYFEGKPALGYRIKQ